jgi:PST family polysaccharide transporter
MQKNRLFGNFISLSVIQGLNYLFPLIAFPYLLHVLTVSGFGVFTLAQTGILLADLVVSFGFGLSATKRISRFAHHPFTINAQILAVYLIKLLLLLFLVFAGVITAFFVPYLQQHWMLFVGGFLFVFGNLLMPDWYFQGVQRMQVLTWITFLSKLCALASLFLLVNTRDDLDWAVLTTASGNLIAGVLGIVAMCYHVRVRLPVIRARHIVLVFKESAIIWSSLILVPLYSSVNVFILRACTSSLMVGYYSIAEKIVGAISMLTSIINRTLFPHLNQLYHQSRQAFHAQVTKMASWTLFAFAIMAAALFLTAESIIYFLGGTSLDGDPQYATSVLKIISVSLIIAPFGSYYFQLLLIVGEKRLAMRNIVIVVLINSITAFPLAYFAAAKGMAVNAVLITLAIAGINYFSWRPLHRSQYR